MEAWQRSELTDVTAKVVTYEAFVEGKLEAPKHLARTGTAYISSRSARSSGRPRICYGYLDIVPSVLFNPSSCTDRDLRADLYPNHFAGRPDRIHKVRKTASGPATRIQNTTPWLELKKLHRFLSQRLYERGSKFGNGRIR